VMVLIVAMIVIVAVAMIIRQKSRDVVNRGTANNSDSDYSDSDDSDIDDESSRPRHDASCSSCKVGVNMESFK